MDLDRRDFMKAASVVAGAIGLGGTGLSRVSQALAAENAAARVIWLQGAGCTGCSVSLLNSIYYMKTVDLLTKTIDLEYHPNLSAAGGDLAIQALQTAKAKAGYILAVEGAVPTAANGLYCTIWPGMTMLQAVKDFAANASMILAIGTCASFGGMSAGAPNPTGAVSVKKALGTTTKPIICIPGCPTSPDWVVGTIAYLLKYGTAPTLDSYGRPVDYYRNTVHSACPRRGTDDDGGRIGGTACMRELGCRGPSTHADCPSRRWNSAGTSTPGVNWCIGAGGPCHGCTEATFPDGMSPFYRLGSSGTGSGGD